MNRILVWDIPARLFHWAFTVSLTAALAIGFLVDKKQAIFQWHMLLGIVALALLSARVVLGFVGSRYSRFRSFPLRPRELVEYVGSAVFAKTRRYAGNNPGSALAAVLMFLLVPALFISGLRLGGEALEDFHEFAAWALFAVIALHLLGLGWHTMRHRDNLALAMITGKKAGQLEDGISSVRPAWGAGFLLLAGIWIYALFADHNSKATTVKLPVVGITLQLGEKHSSGFEKKRERLERD